MVAIDNGRKLDTFRDNWIHGIRASTGEDFETVKTLIQGENWNVATIQNLFPHHISQKVSAIPLPTKLQLDSRFWIHDPKRKYSVRDGYKLDIGCFDPPSKLFGIKGAGNVEVPMVVSDPTQDLNILVESNAQYNFNISKSEGTSCNHQRIV